MQRRLWMTAVLCAVMGMTGCQPSPPADSGSGGGSPAPSGNAGQSLNIKGSDTMVNLVQAWAEEYMKSHPGQQIAVTGGGSGTGIAALENQTADIAMSSREIKDDERASIEKSGGKLTELPVALDALTVAVHPENPVNELSFAQLSQIYTGQVNDWGAVGGKPGRIAVLSREKSSGTHVFFLEHVVRGGNAKGPEEFAPGVLMMPASQALAKEVASNRAAIGYYGMGYHNPAAAKALKVSSGDGKPFVEGTEENVLSGRYPISRSLYLYTAKVPSGIAREFLDYCLSEDGQKIVEQMDFVPLPAKK